MTIVDKVLKQYSSTHVDVQPGWYAADYNIKLQHINFPAMTTKQEEWVEHNFSFLMQCEVDSLLSLLQECYEIKNAYTTGRSGGWITVEFPYELQGYDLAHEVTQIAIFIEEAVTWVCTKLYWQEVLDKNCPAPTFSSAYVLTMQGAGL